ESLDARIFIGGLDLDCSEQDLEKAFGMFGDISQVMVLRDRETNVSRGFAFMSFESQDSADEAIRRMHGVEIMGRCVTVRKAERQAAMADRPRSKRGGFRGGRGGERRGGFQNSRRGYRGSQRGFGDSRSYGDSKSFGESRSYSDSRSGNNYNGSRPMGGGYDEQKRDYNPAPRYESHRDETYGSRGYEDRYSGNNSRTEVA
uniref:RRM domain-containing protein n=1 Tax=Ciona intestinalis TaxID=7719 RepID=H2XX28_CIOIN